MKTRLDLVANTASSWHCSTLLILAWSRRRNERKRVLLKTVVGAGISNLELVDTV
jgi:hypothetical protein